MLTTIATAAARLCDADDAVIHTRDGDAHRRVAIVGSHFDLSLNVATPLSRETVLGRAIVDAAVVHVHDLAASVQTEFAAARESQRQIGHRTVLAAPLIREGAAIGAIALPRREVRPFGERQVALLQTFADQAVIAIENARLFEELERRNAELQESNRQVSEALERQTAMAEILEVIAASRLTRSLCSMRSSSGRCA